MNSPGDEIQTFWSVQFIAHNYNDGNQGGCHPGQMSSDGQTRLTRVSTLASGKTGGKGGYKGHTGWWPPERHVENAATNVTAQACFPITCRTSMHQKDTFTVKH